jgi:hypothetical protein
MYFLHAFNSINKKICASHMFKGHMSLLYVGCMKFLTNRFGGREMSVGIISLVGNFCPVFYMRNARTSPGVLLMFSCNDIDVIKKLHVCPFGWHRCNFLIKKLHLCHSRRTPGEHKKML